MITQEIKERIFALYYGQKIVSGTDWPMWGDDSILLNVIPAQVESDHYLVVNPLSLITDEELQVVLNLQGYVKNPPHLKPFFCTNDKDLSVAFQSDHTDSFEECYSSTVDYLRSLGYALPAFGYSVDQLVEQGVFKLKTTTPNGK